MIYGRICNNIFKLWLYERAIFLSIFHIKLDGKGLATVSTSSAKWSWLHRYKCKWCNHFEVLFLWIYLFIWIWMITWNFSELLSAVPYCSSTFFFPQMYWASCILFHRISEICSTNPILLNVFTIICCIVALYFWPCYHHHYAHKYKIFILCRCQHISHDFILSIEIKEKTDTNEFFRDLHIILNGNWIVANFCLAPFFFFCAGDCG